MCVSYGPSHFAMVPVCHGTSLCAVGRGKCVFVLFSQ